MKVFSLCFLLCASPVLASQDSPPLNPKLRIGIGPQIASGTSKIDLTSPVYTTVATAIDVDVLQTWLALHVSGQWSPDTFGGRSVDTWIYTKAFSIGPVRVGPGIHYFYALDRDVVWDDGSLTVQGRTRKQYVAPGLHVGIGNFIQPHIRFFAGAGVTEMYKEIVLSTGGRSLEGSPTLVDNDMLGIAFVASRIQFPVLWRLHFDTDVRHVRTLTGIQHVYRRLGDNRKLLVPEEQTTVRGDIRTPIFSWLHAGVSGTWSSDQTGMIFLGNSYGTRLTFIF